MNAASDAKNRLWNWSGCFADLLAADQRAVAQLVQNGGAIEGTADQILPRLRRTRMVTILREGENGPVIGVAALKEPSCNYRRNKFAAAGVAIAGFDDAPELGYVVIHANRQRQQLSGGLVELMAQQLSEPTFATTDSNTMRNNLIRSGFTRVGQEWQGNKGALSLWVFAPR